MKQIQKRVINVLSYQILASPIPEKILKNNLNTISLNYQLQREIINLNCLADLILYHTIKKQRCQLSSLHEKKKQQKRLDKLPVRIYVNKIELTLKLNQDMILSPQFLAPQAINLRKSTENKVTKNKKVENIPHLILLM